MRSIVLVSSTIRTIDLVYYSQRYDLVSNAMMSMDLISNAMLVLHWSLVSNAMMSIDLISSAMLALPWSAMQ